MSRPALRRFVTLLAAGTLAAALPMVLCTQVEACSIQASMGQCDMAPGSACCESDASHPPAPGSAQLGAGLAIPAPATPIAGVGAELLASESRPGHALFAEVLAAPVAIYTLLATLLI